ncbi:MAG: YicC family protein [Clostridia bacterium]|nr:YicC family protein [Clostridia bacterium]
MVKSMTGYGKSSLSINSREYQVEIKAVNHKYIDTNIRIPRIISYLEEDIRKLITSKIKRGKIDVSISFDNYSKDGNDIKINTELAKIYIDNLRKLAEEENLSHNIEVTEITRFPDVLTIKSNLDEDQIKTELLQAVEEAINQLVCMRQSEGTRISEDILAKIAQIETKKQEIFELSTGLIDEYIVKLETRIKEILKTDEIDKSRLMQEVVIYADKCSIEEEVTRLKSHIAQLRNLINSEEPSGKKMDFIIQEMNRETNTIGSKANNLEITNRVVDIKTILEDVREQIQNIE